ncbi:hypothetical protein BDV95DRAFT_481777 [Massariosphaeria phaeospora]|uniref:Beta/gamma crystallin 'Greek key' domain-containing protein n=1 Tax=Massariosphaeria phaeospora TaxID=100035 RepID=A0A7C8IIJ5_9PLEO|nr:hypothetical protein BDV95DRAFT_481777 [Massariosphaeria phaeospora]
MMFPRALFTPVLLGLAAGIIGGVRADDPVTEGRIKVFLFASPAFFAEVAVDAQRDKCVSLYNNLIDSKVQSVLVGGHDVAAVSRRRDYWYCVFYNNYECRGEEADMLMFPDGINNIAGDQWEARIHSLRCSVDAPVGAAAEIPATKFPVTPPTESASTVN